MNKVDVLSLKRINSNPLIIGDYLSLEELINAQDFLSTKILIGNALK